MLGLGYCLWFHALAGGNNETAGARSHSLGNASVALVDPWSPTNNVGALGRLDVYSFSSAYESRYFLPEAGFAALSFAAPLGGGSLGIIAHSYGYAAYRESRIGLGYGRKLSELVSLGVQINYVQVRIANDYGASANAVGEVGMLITPNEKLSIGIHIYNPTRSLLADYDRERIPSILRLGLGYAFSEKVRWVGQVEKDMDLPINLQSGLEYQPVESVFLRAGYATLSGSFAFGLGYRWKGISLDLSNQWDQNVGFGATASLSYQFGSRKKTS